MEEDKNSVVDNLNDLNNFILNITIKEKEVKTSTEILQHCQIKNDLQYPREQF